MKKLFLILGGILLLSSSVKAQCYSIDTCWTDVFGYWVSLNDHLWDMKVSQTSGNVYVTGQTHRSFSNDWITIKYNPAGDQVWIQGYNGDATMEDISHSIAIDDSENVYVTGEGYSTAGHKDYVTIKYNSAGVQKWIRTYDGTANGADDFAYSVFVDASHNVYVTGEGEESGNGKDYVTIKYSSGGVVLWTAKYNGGTNHDVAKKVVADNSGNVYVTGESRSTGHGNNYLTVKYNSSGVFQWSKSYNGLGDNDDEPSDLFLDNSGNVYVTGRSIATTLFNRDYVTIKYNSLGVEQWVKSYDGGLSKSDEANSMYVDNSGNVFVTGFSESASSPDYLSIKYNSAGVQQWTARYNGTGNGPDIAQSIRLGNNGKIYVGGGSNGSTTADDFVIVEYDANTGAQCFVNRTSKLNLTDNAYAMELDNVRNIIYACGESNQGGGPHCMTARYCVLGIVNSTYIIKAAIEGIYDPSVDGMNMKDTVRVYLRKNFSPYAVSDSGKAVLDSATLSMSCIFNNTPSSDYYLVLKHRNSIKTWSRAPGDPFSCGNTMNFDFTNAANKAYGNNMKQVDTSPVKFAIFSGDVDQDENIDVTDLVLIYNDAFNFSGGYIRTDLNGDYFADVSDIVIAFNNAINVVGVINP